MKRIQQMLLDQTVDSVPALVQVVIHNGIVEVALKLLVFLHLQPSLI